jgi:hypothetical protein
VTAGCPARAVVPGSTSGVLAASSSRSSRYRT